MKKCSLIDSFPWKPQRVSPTSFSCLLSADAEPSRVCPSWPSWKPSSPWSTDPDSAGSTPPRPGRERCPPHGESLQSEAGVLKKLSFAGLAKPSRLRYSWQGFGLASASYRGLRVHYRPVYKAGYLTADSTENDKIPGVSPLSLAGLAD